MSTELLTKTYYTMNVHVMNAYEVCKAALAHGWVKFEYTKINGEHRVAIGTRCPAMLEMCGGTPRGERQDRQEQNPNLCAYYDLVRGDWRCFKIGNFGGMLFDNLSTERACTEALTIAIYAKEGVEECLRGVTAMLGGETAVRMMNFAVAHSDADIEPAEYESRCRNAVFIAPAHTAHVDIATPAHTEPAEPTAEVVEEPRQTKAEMLAELRQLRERETELLMQLLAD